MILAFSPARIGVVEVSNWKRKPRRVSWLRPPPAGSAPLWLPSAQTALCSANKSNAELKGKRQRKYFCLRAKSNTSILRINAAPDIGDTVTFTQHGRRIDCFVLTD